MKIGETMYEVPGSVLTELRELRAEVARLLPIAEWAATGSCLEPNEEGEPVCGGTCATCIAERLMISLTWGPLDRRGEALADLDALVAELHDKDFV